jgi:membrane protease YdiL (CAAX protease family)
MTTDQSLKISDPKKVKTWVQLIAVLIGVLPLYSSLILYQIRKGQAPSNQGFILYLAVICPLSILIALLLLRFLCKESYSGLNLKPGKWHSELLSTIILAFIIIITNVISQYLLSELLPTSASDSNIRNLFMEMTSSPGMLLIFIGPLVFLGAASEEIVRVFFLNRLWKVWPSTAVKLIFLAISACLFGLIHFYQGPVHVIWASVFGLIMGIHYLLFGRVLPLISAHYLTNALQVIVVALSQ